MLGLEPLYLACEGRLVIMAPKEEAEGIVETLKKCPYSADAAIIGEVIAEEPGRVIMETEIGTQALLPQPGGELLPRICLTRRSQGMETRVAVISIIVEQEDAIEELNILLHEARQYIVGRMGIPYRAKGISIISIVIDAPQDTISALSGKIGHFKRCIRKDCIFECHYSGRRGNTGLIRIAVYGKGGIGKSTTVSNVAAALAEMGLKVMQIGCDPKADSTILLRHGKAVPAVLDLYNEKKQALQLEDMIRIGYNGVICVEAGGPTPGLGCAGRGIITALEKLKELGAYDVYKPDVVLYDVLGDVVCGGFSMPMRGGYADKIFIITSGENMAIHAAANIAMAVENFKNRGYAGLGGLILNRRDVPREEEKVAELADDFHTAVIGTLSHSGQVALAEEQKKTLMECYPTGEMADEYRALAMQMYRICGGILEAKKR